MDSDRHDAQIVGQDQTAGQRLRRRGVIAGIAALTAAAVALRTSEEVAATSGGGPDGTMVLGSNPMNGSNLTTQPTWIRALSGFIEGTSQGSAVAYADATFTTAATQNIDGYHGIGQGTFTGVVGSGGPNGGAGVIGFGGPRGTASDLGFGVLGVASGASNPTPGSAGCGVYGNGAGASRPGVIGNAQSSDGVQGISFSGRGVYGSSGGVCVFGTSTGSYGVLGVSTAPGFAGLTGSTSTAGVPAFAGGSSVPSANAAQFYGGFYIDCTTVAGGQFVVNPMSAKFGTVQHTDGSLRLMASMEAPESWAVDVGKGKLTAGKADVLIDKDFAAVMEPGDYLVFLTPEGDCNGLYVTNKTATGFEVRELKGGTSSLSFTWKVMAHPRAQKSERLAKYVPPTPLKLEVPSEHPVGRDTPAAPPPSPPKEAHHGA